MMNKKRKALGRKLQDMSKVSLQKITKPDLRRTRPSTPKKLARVICITGGKGGTGKSVFTTNLATCLANNGKEVVILDADMGLANIHLLLGVKPKYNISDIISGKHKVHEVMVETDLGFSIISGGSGLTTLADLNDYKIDMLATAFTELESRTDLLLVDTPAGIALETMTFLQAAKEIIVITTPEITAITDAYATIKVTFRDNFNSLIGLVTNRVKSQSEGKYVFKNLNKTVKQYLNKTIIDYEYILEDPAVNKSIAERRPVTAFNPNTQASYCISEIANRIVSAGNQYSDKLKLTTGAFFERMKENLMATAFSRNY